MSSRDAVPSAARYDERLMWDAGAWGVSKLLLDPNEVRGRRRSGARMLVARGSVAAVSIDGPPTFATRAARV